MSLEKKLPSHASVLAWVEKEEKRLQQRLNGLIFAGVNAGERESLFGSLLTIKKTKAFLRGELK